MNINRNNYESFFLLYIDNELSGTDKKLVEEFVTANPDLQEEFIMLQQTVLRLDDVVFDNKSILFREEVSTSGLQEKLLLHLDEELDPAAAEKLTDLISGDVGIQKEWQLLLQTKLAEDTSIIFTDKQSLYRKEKGRVVGFPWMRLAAAAVFVGFSIWAGVTYLSNQQKPNGGEIALDKPLKNEPVEQSTQRTAITGTQDSIVVNQSLSLTKDENTIAVEKSSTPKTRDVQPQQKIAKIPLQPLVKSSSEDQIAQKPKSNNLPVRGFENINNDASNKTVIASVTPQTPTHSIQPGKNEMGTGEETTNGTTNTLATTASFNDSEEKNNDRVLFMPEEKVRKTKLGGIFRKVKRVFERNANINNGNNNIKVANLEFAIQ